MGRDDEATAIAQFIAERGVTRCDSAYAAPTSTPLNSAEEQQRLRRLELSPWLTGKAAYAAGLRAARGRQRAIVAGKAPRR